MENSKQNKKRGLPKGRTNNPHGKPPGTLNKTTTQAREAIARFVDGNAERLTGWLDQIAADDPDAAFRAFMSVVEYHIPKLARVDGEHQHKGNITVRWER